MHYLHMLVRNLIYKKKEILKNILKKLKILTKKGLWKFLFEYGKFSDLYGVETVIFWCQKTYETTLKLFKGNWKNGEKISMGNTGGVGGHGQMRCVLGCTW